MIETKPKLLVLSSSYPRYKGDVNGNFVYELVIRLKSNFDIYVLVPAYKGSLSFEIIDDIKIYRHRQFFLNRVELAYGSDILAKIKKNFLFIFIVPIFLLFQFLKIRKVAKKEKIKLIHAHWLIPQGFLAVLYKFFFNRNIKIVSTVHGADINSFETFFGRKLKIFILKRIDKLAVVSNALKEKTINLGYSKNVYVYPMGVDTILFSPEKKSDGLKKKLVINGVFLLFVGGLLERKGIRYLIQAMPLVIKEFSDAKLIVVGDGNLKNEMIELTSQLNVSENVIFTGSISNEELPSYFATADLFILPSFSEGFGLVIIEALSCKSLVVTSNLDVIHDIILEKETGFFFEEINKDAISVEIISILQNKEKYENIRERGRQHVIKNFDWNIVSINYTNLLNSLI